MTNKDFKLKEILMVLVSVFIIVLIFYFGVKSFNEINNRTGQQNTISVSGKGEIFIKPDIAKVSVSVEKNAYSVSEAQSQATNAINNVIKFLKDSGLEDKDIKTVNYSIYPRYDYLENQGRVFRGYTVSQTLEIKLRKIEDTGKILADVTRAGANQIGGVSFTIDDEEGVKRQARQEAINDAQTKAKQLAKDLGIKIVRLVSFSESGNDYYPPYYTESAKVLGTGGGPEPEIPSGENKVTVNVNLVYQIK
jgi:hypothetical protein